VVLCADLPSPALDAPGDSQMPIFVEIVQAPLWPDSSAPMPPADDSPIGAFAFDPTSRLLLVQPSVQILSTTEVLVGLTEALPGMPHVSCELFQIPSAQAAPLTVITIDADTATLTVAYGDHTFEIRPGQSLSFKEKREGEPVATEVTTIINHGRLAAIGLLPTGPTGR